MIALLHGREEGVHIDVNDLPHGVARSCPFRNMIGTFMYPVTNRWYSASSLVEKLLHLGNKGIKLIVMNPMPGLLEHGDAGVPEMIEPPIVRRIGGPALATKTRKASAWDRGGKSV